MDTSQWPALLLLVALLPSRTLCQTEPTTSLTTRDGIDSVAPSPLPNAYAESAADSTFKPSDDYSFSSTTTRTPLEDYDKFNELYSALSDKKSSSKSNKPLSERTKATKFQGDTTTVSPPPAPVFTTTEVPASPEGPLKTDLPGSHAEEKPIATLQDTLPRERASSPLGQVPGSLTDLPAPPASPAGDFGNQPVYVPTPDGATYPFEGTGAVGISPPIGNSEAPYAAPSGGLPFDNLAGTLSPQLTNGEWAPHFDPQADPSRSPTLEAGQAFGHGGEGTAVPSNSREISSQSESTFPFSDGVSPPTADTQGSFETPVAADEPQSHQYYNGPSSYGYGREALPETTTALPPSNADLLGSGPSTDGVAPSVSDVSGTVFEPVNSALTTPQPEQLSVSNSVQGVLPEEKSATENGGTTTSSPDPVPPSETAALAFNDSKTGRSMNLEGDSMTASTTPAGISEQEKHASPMATTSPSSIDATTSASQTSGAQEIDQGPTGDVYVSQALPSSTPKVEETTQHLEITTVLSTDGKVDEEDSLTLYPDRYHPTSTVNVTTTAPSQMTPSLESSTSVPAATTQSGVAGTTEHEEMTAAGVTEGVSAVDVTGTTTSPTNSFATSTANVAEISTDLPSSSPTASSNTSPPTLTPLTDAPTTVEHVTTHHILAENATSLPPTSTFSIIASTTTQPESPQPTTTVPINQGSTVVDATTNESNTKSPTTAEPTTTIDSFEARSKNAESTTSEPATAWPVTAQPTSTEIPTTEPTTAASTTLVPVTTEPLKENPTTVEPSTTRMVILDLTTVEGMSEAPMTQAHTTAVPTTEGPTTTVPTNAVKTTEVSATEVHTTPVPTTEVPTTEVPTTDIPTTDVPTTDVSMTEAPATDVPATDVPTTEVPTTAVPTTAAPTTAAPTTAAPTIAAPTTSESTTVESTTPEVTTLPSVMPVSIFGLAGTSTTEAHTTPETVSTTTEGTTTPEGTSVATSGILVGRGPSVEQEQPTTRAATTPEPQVGEMTTAGALDPWTTLVHSASRNPKQLTHPTTSSPEQAASNLPTDATTAVVSDAAFTTVTPLDTFTSSESGEQETTTRRDLFTTLFPEITTMMKASTTTEAAPTTAQVVVVSDNSIETETVATVTADVSCNIEARNLTVACLLPQELNNTVTVKFSEWDHGRTEAFRIEAKRRLADYCFRKGIPLGDTTVVFVANEHGMDLISFFVINQARGSVVPAATLIAFLNETKPTLEDAVNLTINDVSLGLPSVETKTASTGVASILGGPFKALYVIIAASVAALLILVVIIVLMIKCRSLSSNQYSPDVEKLTKDLHMRSDIGDLRPGDEILKEEAQLKDASAFVINGNGTHLTRDGDGWVVPYSQVPTEAKNGIPDAQDTRL